MNRILAAVDLSDATEAVLDASLALAKHEGAKLSILYTAPVIPATIMGWDGVGYVPPEFDDEQAEVDRAMTLLRRILDARGVKDAECLCLRGDAADTIRELAEELQADLIVLGAHDHGKVYHTVFGSVREAILAHSPCSVLVVPHHEVAA
jgi:nucleotide-binding universal stress UspA family protein